MMVLSEKPKIIISKANIIYKPKPKKVYKSKPNYSLFHFPSNSCHVLKEKKIPKNLDLNLTKKTRSEKFDVNRISLEEMEKDFKRLKTKREITTVERELKQIMEDSTKDTSIDDKNNNTKKVKVKRPKNEKYILYKNFDFDFDYLE